MATDATDEEKAEIIELKPEWERFCQLVISHGNPTKQYQVAYPDSSEEAARRSAHRLMTNADIQARMAQLRAEMRGAFAQEREDLLTKLFRIVDSSPDEAASDNPLCELTMTQKGPAVVFPSMLGCIQEINKMMGNHAADKIDLSSKDGSMTPAVIERRVIDPKEGEK